MTSAAGEVTASRREASLTAPEHGASLAAGRAGILALRALRARFADRDAFAVVASEATAAMENSEAAVWILMHFHSRPDEVRTQRACRYL